VDFGAAEIWLSKMVSEGTDKDAARVPILSSETEEEIGSLTFSIKGIDILKGAVQ